jgi:hypothetical protein
MLIPVVLLALSAIVATPTPEPTATPTLSPTRTHTPTPGYRVEVKSSSFTLEGVSVRILYVYDGADASRKGAVYHEATLEVKRNDGESDADLRARAQGEVKKYVLANKHAWEPASDASVPTPSL